MFPRRTRRESLEGDTSMVCCSEIIPPFSSAKDTALRTGGLFVFALLAELAIPLSTDDARSMLRLGGGYGMCFLIRLLSLSLAVSDVEVDVDCGIAADDSCNDSDSGSMFSFDISTLP